MIENRLHEGVPVVEHQELAVPHFEVELDHLDLLQKMDVECRSYALRFPSFGRLLEMPVVDEIPERLLRECNSREELHGFALVELCQGDVLRYLRYYCPSYHHYMLEESEGDP